MAQLKDTIISGDLRVTGDINATKLNNVTIGSSPKFTDTTYSNGNGINLSGTTFSAAFPTSGTPAALGTASNGSSNNVARADHVHAKPTYSKSDVGLANVANLDQSKAIKSITRSGTTFTYTALDGTTGTFTQQDNNTTYTGANGVSVSGTTISNSGVRSVATGSANGTISVNTNGTAADVAVKGLGTAAYTASTAYAAASHNHDDRYYTESEVDTKLSGKAASSHSHSADDISGGYLNIHPENSPTLIPFIHNDIAFLLKRGGSAVVTYDGTVKNVDISNVFDGTPSYWGINPTGITTIVIELTLHKTFAYSNWIYVDFGAAGWRAKSIKIEVMNTNYSGDTWAQKASTTTNGLGHYAIAMNHVPVGASNAGGGFNKIRFTFNSFATATGFRIAQLGVYNYGSYGLSETFVSRGGSEIFGTINPYQNNGADLGTSAKYFNNAYITKLNGVAVGNSPKFTDTTYSFDTTPTAGSQNPVTSGGIKTALDGKAASSHVHGNITNAGAITANTAIAFGDQIIAADISNGGKLIRTGITFGNSKSEVLANDGTWVNNLPEHDHLDIHTKAEKSVVTNNIELSYIASKNYTAGALAIVNGQLLRVTQNIASGGNITIGSNAQAVDLETLIAEKAEKILVAKLPFLSSASLYNDTADFHNAMPRNKDITAYLTDGSLWKRINGSNGYSLFEDLYVGDYLVAGGQGYMIVDFDYYIRCGQTHDLNEHHLVMMPVGNMSIPEGTVLYNTDTSAEVQTLELINTANAGVTVTSQETAVLKKWNASMDAPDTHTTAGGYKYSRMRQVIMKAADTIVRGAFGADHVKNIDVLYPNPAYATESGIISSWTWFNNTDWNKNSRMSICDLPNEVQICGNMVSMTSIYEVGIDKWQFSLFRYDRRRVNIRSSWWLRSVSDATKACCMTMTGNIDSAGTAYAGGVRPRFVLVG